MNKRLDILEREEDIRQWIKENQSKAFMCKELKCKSLTLNTYLEKMGIQYTGNQGHRGFYCPKQWTPIEDYLNNKKTIQSFKLKEKLLKMKIKDRKCEVCGLTEWQGVPIPLELHHEDGNPYNNNLTNLKMLCPNCHALTEGYRGRGTKAYKVSHGINQNNVKKQIKIKPRSQEKKKCCVDCGAPIDKKSIRCKSCAGKERQKEKIKMRPSKDILKQLIRTTPFLQIGKNFGVTDNTIRKWCKSYQLPYSSKEIKKYSNEEWNKI